MGVDSPLAAAPIHLHLLPCSTFFSAVVPRSTPAKPKVPKIPGARKPSAPVAAAPCPDCGQLGHASGDPACKKAYVSGDALNDIL
jgi:hypothetical protein